MPEFAFDISLLAVARVIADNEEEARRLMHEVIDCIDLSGTPGTVDNNVTLTEASQDHSVKPLLFEVDGDDPPFTSEEISMPPPVDLRGLGEGRQA